MKVILIGKKFFPGKKTASGYFFNFALTMTELHSMTRTGCKLMSSVALHLY